MIHGLGGCYHRSGAGPAVSVSPSMASVGLVSSSTCRPAYGRLENVCHKSVKNSQANKKRKYKSHRCVWQTESWRASLPISTWRKVQLNESDKVACHTLALCTFGLCARSCMPTNLNNLKQVASRPIQETTAFQIEFLSEISILTESWS